MFRKEGFYTSPPESSGFFHLSSKSRIVRRPDSDPQPSVGVLPEPAHFSPKTSSMLTSPRQLFQKYGRCDDQSGAMLEMHAAFLAAWSPLLCPCAVQASCSDWMGRYSLPLSTRMSHFPQFVCRLPGCTWTGTSVVGECNSRGRPKLPYSETGLKHRQAWSTMHYTTSSTRHLYS